jgi:hypothetical protein
VARDLAAEDRALVAHPRLEEGVADAVDVGAPAGALDGWRSGVERQAMLRAALFRVLSDRPCDVERYAGLGLG